MNDNKNAELDRKIRLGWYLSGVGVLLLVTGFILNTPTIRLGINPKLVAALGVLSVGCATGVLTKYIMLRRNPDVAKRVLTEESDERNRAIRYRSGSKAFEIALLTSSIILIIYSMTGNGASRTQPDLLWYVLALQVALPLSVYIINLIRYQSRF